MSRMAARSCSLVQGSLRLLEVGDIDSYPMNKPGPTILPPDHLGFALKPEHPAVSRDDTVGGSQWFAGQKHFRRFHAPSRFVVRMNLLIPPHRVFQPFALRKTKRRLNLRADIGFRRIPLSRYAMNTTAGICSTSARYFASRFMAGGFQSRVRIHCFDRIGGSYWS